MEISSSRLIDSMSKAWRIWAQPLRRICTTCGLIGRRIELGFDRLRLGQDFAERQRSRKNLYENSVHGGAAEREQARLEGRQPIENGEYSHPILTKRLFLGLGVKAPSHAAMASHGQRTARN